jgi:S1-C subfamily serine protease
LRFIQGAVMVSYKCALGTVDKFSKLSLALSLCVALLGCTTVPSSLSNSQSTPPKGEPFSALTIAQIRADAVAKGWAFQIDGKTAQSHNLYFARPQTLIRVGNYARFVQLEIRETPLKVGNEWILASVTTSQIDCVNRTRQILNAELYSDRAFTQRVGTFNQSLQPSGIRVGTTDDFMLLKACSGNLGGQGQVASVQPGTSPRPPSNSSGSGIILAKSSVITNQHVVASCNRVDVIHNGQRYGASVTKRDAKNDLALLQVENLPAVLYPSLRRKAISGEGVMVAGYPLAGLLSSDLIVTDGIVNALSGIANNASQLQISAPVQPGNSGGPLIDKSGALVGVVVSKLNALRAAAMTGDVPQNINFAIKPEVLRSFLESENLALTASDPGQRLETEVLAERAKGFTIKVECKQ